VTDGLNVHAAPSAVRAGDARWPAAAGAWERRRVGKSRVSTTQAACSRGGLFIWRMRVNID
jgi:hypothetical protein